MDKKVRFLIWILVGSCILNLILAFNAGQKRKVAVVKADDLNVRLEEIELRYKNAVQSYDALAKSLQQAKKDLEDQQRFSETLKETLAEEQAKSASLREELQKREVEKMKPSAKRTPAANTALNVQTKQDRTTRRW